MKQILLAVSLIAASQWAQAADFMSATLPDLAGKPQAMKQWQGKPLVVNYWATWCGPCRQEMPELVELQKKYQGKIQFIGIAIDEVKPVTVFVKQYKVNFPTLIGGNSAMDMMRAQGNVQGGLPFTVIYDAKGKQVFKELGRIHKDKLDGQLKALIK
jgi:thiol-disulfide isomerase/thioredoxin